MGSVAEPQEEILHAGMSPARDSAMQVDAEGAASPLGKHTDFGTSAHPKRLSRGKKQSTEDNGPGRVTPTKAGQAAKKARISDGKAVDDVTPSSDASIEAGVLPDHGPFAYPARFAKRKHMHGAISIDREGNTRLFGGCRASRPSNPTDVCRTLCLCVCSSRAWQTCMRSRSHASSSTESVG